MSEDSFEWINGALDGVSRMMRRLQDEVAYAASGGHEVDQNLRELDLLSRLKRGCRR